MSFNAKSLIFYLNSLGLDCRSGHDGCFRVLMSAGSGSSVEATVLHAAASRTLLLYIPSFGPVADTPRTRAVTLEILHDFMRAVTHVRCVLDDVCGEVRSEVRLPTPRTKDDFDAVAQALQELLSAGTSMTARLRFHLDMLDPPSTTASTSPPAERSAEQDPTTSMFEFDPEACARDERHRRSRERRAALMRRKDLPRPSIPRAAKALPSFAWTQEEMDLVNSFFKDEIAVKLIGYLLPSELSLLRREGNDWVLPLGGQLFLACRLTAAYDIGIDRGDADCRTNLSCVELVKDAILLAAAHGVHSREELLASCIPAAPCVLPLLDMCIPHGHTLSRVARVILDKSLVAGQMISFTISGQETLQLTDSGRVRAASAFHDRWAGAMR